MELKLASCAIAQRSVLSLNCTVMELKHMIKFRLEVVKQSLNCTVMELKLIYSYRLILRSGS